MNDRLTEQILEQIITEYRKRMRPKVFCYITEDDEYSKAFVQGFHKSGLATAGMKGVNDSCDQVLPDWQEAQDLRNENLKGIFAYGLGVQEALALLEGRATGDLLLFLMKNVRRVPVWIGFTDLQKPFNNPDSEAGRQLLLNSLEKKGYRILGNFNRRPPEEEMKDSQGNHYGDRGLEIQQVPDKKFITLRDLELVDGGVLEIGRHSRCTMALEDYCRDQGIEIRRV